ncbi:class I SAM-dependent methyltransferase [Marinicella sp. S1101]|uniref:class I SAM-dependent methyltransferase n=1 Tax=Marinicella marina TaxID=2996016 RepID=UPI002260D308|nr:class I SAM-dependent methyltransferase [Marinicella marina]MCX7553263.1 class I SAM-dependent methyltransferase [Marinicella marina]MDJ1138995.1 class I SAM-dependent methyltransferase [Marinicella marina]
MIVNKIHNHEQYTEYATDQVEVFKQRYLETLELEQINSNKDLTFTFKGYSIPANKEVDFLVDWQHSDGVNINWRERLVCPETQLCNRLRASYHLMIDHVEVKPEDCIYITEQVTPFYRFLKQKFPDIIGSEYIESGVASGQKSEQGVRHEDLTDLSFKTNSIDHIFSFDVLEHVPNYNRALKECLRVLKPNGSILMSFPFDCQAEKNLVRASIKKDGSIEHHVEPEYHGDPTNDSGILSFYTFGWELLDEMRKMGFKDVYVASYWSHEFGYLGPEQVSIIAKKSKLRGFIHMLKGMLTDALNYFK